MVCLARLSRLVTVALLALPLAVLAQPAGPGAVKNRVVMQVSDADADKWNLALNNAGNLQTALGAGNVVIEIVAYGPGIGMLKLGSPVGNRVAAALDAGIDLVACENTMAARKLTKEDMLPRIAYVSAGVVEIMQKQQQGYAYLRP